MFYKCCNCGHVFEDGEEAVWSESRGEFWGASCSEGVCGCPVCRGDFEEAYACELCGSVQTEENIKGGVCLECLEPYKNDFDACLKITEGTRESVMLNVAIVSMLSEEEMEKILIDYIKKNNTDFSPIVDSDAEWFGETVTRKEKEK